jgi:hypothetical protein
MNRDTQNVDMPATYRMLFRIPGAPCYDLFNPFSFSINGKVSYEP